MAIDEHLMGLAESGEIGFAFRLYRWSPACVSFGRLQDPRREADLRAIASAGVGLVRRPTGGRAVWHENEITYSVVAGPGHPLAGKAVEESLAMTGEALLGPLRELGVPASLSPPARRDPHARTAGNPCFTSHGTSEIAVGNRKLIGSAQARSRGVFLEHGSLLLRNDQLRLLPFLRIPAGARDVLSSRLSEGTCCLAEVAPGLDTAELETLLIDSFALLGGGDLERVPPPDTAGGELAGRIRRREEEARAWLSTSL